MATKKKAMTLREWWKEVGTENVEKVIAIVGTSLPYLRLISYRQKRPGYDLMLRIIDAANSVTPGFAPDLTLCMEPLPKRKPNPNYSPVLKPSKAFLRAASKAAAVRNA